MDTTRSSILARIRSTDDSRAWVEFDSIYRPIIYRFARSFRLSPDQADETVQAVMFRISRKIKNFQYDPRKGRFRGWVFKLVERHTRDLRAKRVLPIADSGELRNLVDEETPERVFEGIWRQEHVRRCLELVRLEVEESTYQAYYWHVIEQLGVDEVCQRLGMNPGQVYTIKWRITQKLIERFRDYPDLW